MTAEGQLTDALYQILREIQQPGLSSHRTALDQIERLANDALGITPTETGSTP